MSADSHEYYHRSSSSGSSRPTNKADHERHGGHGLPPIREVVGDELNTPLPRDRMRNISVRHGAAPLWEPGGHLVHRSMSNVFAQSTHTSSRSGPIPTLTSRYEPSSQSKPSSYGHNTGFDYHRSPTISPSAHQLSRAPPGQASYIVFAQPDPRRGLVTVSSSSSPQGIMRDHAVVAGGQSGMDDAKRRFECHVCGRKMERQSVYTQHLITHTDERPHICTVCGKTFNSKSNLNRHMLTHGTKGFRHEDASGNGSASSSKNFYNYSRKN